MSFLDTVFAIGGRALAGTPEPTATIGFDQLFPARVGDASVVFLSENSLALLLRSTSLNQWKILTLALNDGQLRTVASADNAGEGTRIFSVSDSRVIVAGARLKYLYSQKLDQRWELLMGTLCKQFPASEIVGESGPKGHRVFKLTALPTAIQSGIGDLLAVSSRMLAYQVSGSIRIVTPDGVARGSIRSSQ